MSFFNWNGESSVSEPLVFSSSVHILGGATYMPVQPIHQFSASQDYREVSEILSNRGGRPLSLEEIDRFSNSI